MNGKSVLTVIGMVAVLGGCAKDRTIEDYRREQVEQEEAAMDAVTGIYRGTFNSSVDGSVIGPVSVDVEADRETAQAGNAPEAEQEAVLKITVQLTAGQQIKVLTFNDGAYDREALQFKATTVVTNRGTAELRGTFSGGSIVGALEADGYPDRGGVLNISRGTALPQLKETRAAQEDKFLFNSFSAIGNFHNHSANAEDDRVYMTILRQVSVSEQDLMDEITPYRYVDAAVYFNENEADGTHRQVGGIFSNTVWDVRAKTLTGVFTSAAGQGLAPTELKLTCTQSGPGWNCQEVALTNAMGLVFSALFTPSGGINQ